MSPASTAIRFERLGRAWDEALAADWPVILDVRTDPKVAPLPSHGTLAQAKAFMSSIAKGDRGAARVIANTVQQSLREVLPSGDKT